ncbi:MAG: hypothetical protein ACRDOK_14070 [Streptosporangiaceae bacterium]
MITWQEFASQQRALAREGADLLYHFGVGLAFLSTVRADGGPRLHPVCPVVTYTGLYAFIVPSPKQRDLHRDGRYAMHSFPLEDNEDAFYVTGTARHVPDPEIRSQLAKQFADERSAVGVPPPGEGQHLFEFRVQTAMVTRTTGHGDPEPRPSIWRAA